MEHRIRNRYRWATGILSALLVWTLIGIWSLARENRRLSELNDDLERIFSRANIESVYPFGKYESSVQALEATEQSVGVAPENLDEERLRLLVQLRAYHHARAALESARKSESDPAEALEYASAIMDSAVEPVSIFLLPPSAINKLSPEERKDYEERIQVYRERTQKTLKEIEEHQKDLTSIRESKERHDDGEATFETQDSEPEPQTATEIEKPEATRQSHGVDQPTRAKTSPQESALGVAHRDPAPIDEVQKAFEKLPDGALRYEPRREMSQGQPEAIQARVYPNLDRAKEEADRERHKVEEVKVSSRKMCMDLKALDMNSFEIELLTERCQAVIEPFAEWRWSAMPLKAGNQELHLAVSGVVILADGKTEVTTTYEPRTGLIVVNRDLKWITIQVSKQKWWQILIGIGVVLFGTYKIWLEDYLERRREESDHPGDDGDHTSPAVPDQAADPQANKPGQPFDGH